MAGFTFIFTLLGVFAGSIGTFLMKYQNIVNVVCGLVIIYFGLSYLDSDTNNTTSDSDTSTIIPAMNFTVYTQAEEAVNLSDFYGKPIIVNFWATWCGPCKSELPAFEQLYKEYGDDVTYSVYSIPATLFIDADGNIVASHMGAMSQSTLRNYMENMLIPAE